MPSRLTLTPHLSPAELDQRARACRNATEQVHWQMLRLVAQGHTGPTVARLTGYSENWVRTIVHRYNANGPAGIVDRRQDNRGRPVLVPPDVRAALRDRLADPPPDGGLWTGPKVAAWLSARLDRPISPQRAWETLQRIGFSLRQPRPHNPVADPAAQDAFKKGA